MNQLNVIKPGGTTEKTRTLSDELTKLTPKAYIVHFVQNAINRNSRLMRAGHYQTVGSVARTHKKYGPQKGTGRARQGSRKGIHMIGGGTAFGFNQNRDTGKSVARSYTKVNKKIKALAMAYTLLNRHQNQALKIVDLSSLDKKTKVAKAQLDAALPNWTSGSVLVVHKLNNSDLFGIKNIVNLRLARAEEVNVLDILKSKMLLIDLTAIDSINAKLSNYKNLTFLKEDAHQN